MCGCKKEEGGRTRKEEGRRRRRKMEKEEGRRESEEGRIGCFRPYTFCARQYITSAHRMGCIPSSLLSPLLTWQQLEQKTWPQARQWWRLKNRVNFLLHLWHCLYALPSSSDFLRLAPYLAAAPRAYLQRQRGRERERTSERKRKRERGKEGEIERVR